MSIPCPICGKEMRDIVHFKDANGDNMKALHCWEDDRTIILYQSTESVTWKKELE